jgi:hypothetical protein
MPAGYNAALAVKVGCVLIGVRLDSMAQLFDFRFVDQHCDRAAMQIVTLLQTWHRLHDLRFTPPTALQCCFIAGTTHLLSFASSRTEKKQADALSRAQECIRLMSYMAVSWPAAQQKQKLLEDLLGEYGMSVSSRSDGKTLAETKSQPHIFGMDGVRHSYQSPQVITIPRNVLPAAPPEQAPRDTARATSFSDHVTAMQQMSTSFSGVNMDSSNDSGFINDFDLLTRQVDPVGLRYGCDSDVGF